MQFRWNAKAARYVNASGRFVSRTKVRDALDEALDKSARRIDRVSRRLADGEITVAHWRTTMRREIKNTQLYSAASARGGWAQLDARELGRVGGLVGQQYKYLDDFAADIRRGRVGANGVASRARMYAQGGRRVYHETEREVNLVAGYTQERNYLGRADHCSACVGESRRRWVAIGDLQPVGTRICLSNCRCYIGYR